MRKTNLSMASEDKATRVARVGLELHTRIMSADHAPPMFTGAVTYSEYRDASIRRIVSLTNSRFVTEFESTPQRAFTAAFQRAYRMATEESRGAGGDGDGGGSASNTYVIRTHAEPSHNNDSRSQAVKDRLRQKLQRHASAPTGAAGAADGRGKVAKPKLAVPARLAEYVTDLSDGCLKLASKSDTGALELIATRDIAAGQVVVVESSLIRNLTPLAPMSQLAPPMAHAIASVAAIAELFNGTAQGDVVWAMMQAADRLPGAEIHCHKHIVEDATAILGDQLEYLADVSLPAKALVREALLVMSLSTATSVTPEYRTSRSIDASTDGAGSAVGGTAAAAAAGAAAGGDAKRRRRTKKKKKNKTKNKRTSPSSSSSSSSSSWGEKKSKILKHAEDITSHSASTAAAAAAAAATAASLALTAAAVSERENVYVATLMFLRSCVPAVCLPTCWDATDTAPHIPNVAVLQSAPTTTARCRSHRHVWQDNFIALRSIRCGEALVRGRVPRTGELTTCACAACAALRRDRARPRAHVTNPYINMHLRVPIMVQQQTQSTMRSFAERQLQAQVSMEWQRHHASSICLSTNMLASIDGVVIPWSFLATGLWDVHMFACTIDKRVPDVLTDCPEVKVCLQSDVHADGRRARYWEALIRFFVQAFCYMPRSRVKGVRLPTQLYDRTLVACACVSCQLAAAS